ANVRRLRTLLALLDVEFELLIFVQVAVAGTLDSGEVCEDISGAIIWSDEAVALVGVEPFYCACGHNIIPYFLNCDHIRDHIPVPTVSARNSFLWGQKHCPASRSGCDKTRDRKSTRLNSSHVSISYAVFCLKKKKDICNESEEEA